MAEPIIKVRELTARFGDHTVLQDVSFAVDPGEVVVVAGGSGCGKSTLMRHMLGLHELAGGQVEILGVDVGRAGPEELQNMHENVGVLFQSAALFGSMTLMENITMGLRDFGGLSRRDAETVAKAKLSLVGLSRYENHLPGEISGGMKKRAGLARAMSLDPGVLFFDEPGAGLDPITMAGMDQLILDINQGLGTTMIVITHDLPSIMTIAQRVIMLDKDQKGIIATGSPRELQDNSQDPRVVNFFLRKAMNQ